MPEAVMIWALWRGQEISGSGTATLTADVVMVSTDTSRLAVPIDELDGAHIEPARLSLYHRSGDVIEISGADAVRLGREIVAHACDVPELTVPLRALGSTRARPGVDHDRFFGPFLAARRAAARASDPEGRLAAVDATAIASNVGTTVRELAAERY
ncbi:MAG TPA: hypothetical protein VFA43_26125, partial [Gemmatimonadaceae bacterium]|nr:hypothetical protein [Gemmatimonadaceae bacterium]